MGGIDGVVLDPGIEEAQTPTAEGAVVVTRAIMGETPRRRYTGQIAMTTWWEVVGGCTCVATYGRVAGHLNKHVPSLRLSEVNFALPTPTCT
jgi:hypothetical protein